MFNPDHLTLRLHRGDSRLSDELVRFLHFCFEVATRDENSDVVHQTCGEEIVFVGQSIDLPEVASGAGDGEGVFPERLLRRRVGVTREGPSHRNADRKRSNRVESDEGDRMAERRDGAWQRVERGVHELEDLGGEPLVLVHDRGEVRARGVGVLGDLGQPEDDLGEARNVVDSLHHALQASMRVAIGRVLRRRHALSTVAEPSGPALPMLRGEPRTHHDPCQ